MENVCIVANSKMEKYILSYDHSGIIYRTSNLAVCIQFGNVEKIGVKSLCDLISDQAAYSILVEY